MKETCRTGTHFRQHYVKYRDTYQKAAWGHCVSPRMKIRRVDDSICTYYIDKTKENHCSNETAVRRE